jgi:hypothetical protein
MFPEDLAATDHGASRLSEISSLEDDMSTALVPANIRALGGKIVSANEEDDEIEIHGPGLRDCEPREHPITVCSSFETWVMTTTRLTHVTRISRACSQISRRRFNGTRTACAKLWII